MRAVQQALSLPEKGREGKRFCAPRRGRAPSGRDQEDRQVKIKRIAGSSTVLRHETER